jgi:very-short-patch-repair endonuclease
MSPPEAILWRVLRTRPAGLKFRRQHPVGPFVLDFYCASVRLGIEVDGMAHGLGDHPASDGQRDAWLRTHDITVLRINAEEVFGNAENVLRLILTACAASPPPATLVPLPMGSAHREDEKASKACAILTLGRSGRITQAESP